MVKMGVSPCCAVSSLLIIRTSNYPVCSDLCSHQTFKTHLSLVPKSSPSDSLSVGRNGFLVFAQNRRSRTRDSVVGLEDFAGVDEFDFVDEDDEFDGDEDLDEDDNEDDHEDDAITIPFGKMNAWLENRPRGFGEGKVYDTSIEQNLLEEIEQSRKAQLANINKLKNNEPNIQQKEEQKVSEDDPTGYRVRITQLPRKKNIHRDLKSAFKGVSGIVSILPSVSGNKKTKDPICTGIAFVDFKSLEDTNRFIQAFSGQKITFGKVEKKVKCELVERELLADNRHNASQKVRYELATIAEREHLADDRHDASQLTLSTADAERETDADTVETDPSLDLRSDSDYEEPCDTDDDVVEDMESLTLSWNDDEESKKSYAPDSMSSNHVEKTREIKKKSASNMKADKLPRSPIPAAAKRLKVRDKAMLADVLSRYGKKSAMASRER